METRVNVEEGKKYLYVETTEEGIKRQLPEKEEKRWSFFWKVLRL